MRNSNPRRDQIEIVAEILEKAKRGSKKTNIMSGCRLSYALNKKYLQALLDSGFLDLTPDGQYIATPEGRNAIEIAEKARRTFNGFYERLRKK